MLNPKNNLLWMQEKKTLEEKHLYELEQEILGPKSAEGLLSTREQKQ